MKKFHIQVPASGHLTRVKLATAALCLVGLGAGAVAAPVAQAQTTRTQKAGDLFTYTSPMTTKREAQSATLLGNGQVLIAGGFDGNSTMLKSAELYNPATRKWSATGAMTMARYGQTVTRLKDGRVLFVGGEDNSGGRYTSARLLASAEVYNPATGKFTATGAPKTARKDAKATLLADGRVLVSGGISTDGTTQRTFNGAELYDPATGQFTKTGAMKVARMDHAMTLLGDGKVLIAGGTGDKLLASAELYDPVTGTFRATGSMKYARQSGLATRLTHGLVLITAGKGIGGAKGEYSDTDLKSAELYNRATGKFTPTGSLQTEHSQRAATLLKTGQVLITGGYSAELYSPAKGAFSHIGWMKTPRERHTATLLGNGQVLLAGGVNREIIGGNDRGVTIVANAELCDPVPSKFRTTGGPRFATTATLLGNGKMLLTNVGNYATGVSSAELYDPATGASQTGIPMKGTHSGYSATLLKNGKVFFVGNSDTNLAELYDPATNRFSATGSVKRKRAYHSATRLKNGKVLIVNGEPNGSGPSAELYDPATGKWSATGAPKMKRDGHTATLLSNGQVLITGGTNPATNSLASAELYNPATGKFRLTGPLKSARHSASATLLPNGKVLIAGGYSFSGLQKPSSLKGAELYNPATGRFTNTGAMKVERDSHTATLLPNGKVLVTGGNNSMSLSYGNPVQNPVASAELYDPATGQFKATGSMTIPRMDHTATLLKNGHVVVMTGYVDDYNPATGKFTSN